ncbi:DNA mismatch repair protein [Xylographa parallela]|nr:DNA mismatch repair protein [Xylographa parallela]
MGRDCRIICPLPADVAAQIKSSTLITSLAHAVLGLIENALDAEATEIVVNVDFGRAACSVEDNGIGIVPTDFTEKAGLGKPYHTSYTGESTKRLGRNGTFLSSLAALAILTVTSRHLSYNSTSTIIYHHSRAAARLIPSPAHYQLNVRSHGTRVQVQDLFGNMPVRVKQRPATDSARRFREKEWEWLRKNITGLLLAWDSPICLTVQGFDKSNILRFKSPVLSPILPESLSKPSIPARSFNLNFIRNTLHTGAGIDLSDWNTWIKTSARTPFLTLRGIISLEPAPSKEAQFICLGLRYLRQDSDCNILYDHVNSLFASSAFGIQEKLDHIPEKVTGRDETERYLKQDGVTQKQLKGGGKGVDRWPMFFIRVDSNVGDSLPWRSELGLMEQSNTLSSIIKVLEVMIIEYLSENHLRPRKPRTKKLETSLTDHSRPINQRSPVHNMPCRPPKDMSEARHVKSSLLSPQTLKSVTINLGDLVDNTKLPKLLRTESNRSRADFSGWSRIKGSLKEDHSNTRRDTKLNLLRPASPQECDIVQEFYENQDAQICCSMAKPSIPILRHDSLVLDHRTGTMPAMATSVIGTTNTMLTGHGSCLPDSDHTESGDLILTWTNPVSKANVKINSRTGSVVEDQHESRLRAFSATRDPHKSSYSSKSNQKLQPIVTSSTIKSLSVPRTGSWAETFLKNWDNPIFRRTEEAIPRIPEQLTEICGGQGSLPGNDRNSHGSIKRAFTDPSISFAARLDKHDLRNAKIIAQVDNKYILIKVALGIPNHVGNDRLVDDNHVLVLVDQHAADERIRIEALLTDLCVKAAHTSTKLISNLGFHSGIETKRLAKPISFPVKAREHSLFEQNAVHFAKWGILYNLNCSSLSSERAEPNREATIVVLTLPAAIAERCRVDVKHLIELLRGEVWTREQVGVHGTLQANILDKNKPDTQCFTPSEEAESQQPWPELIHDCPQGILDMLNSRSCRSAIMFNDKLTLGECETLVQRLATCFFPFQCAHGRPSMVPLVNLDSSEYFARSTLQVGKKERVGRGTADFREAWVELMAH